MTDFFISYNGKDINWATWIAQKLEDADYTTVIQAWDFRPGENFVLEMHKATTGTDRTIAVLSQNYLDAEFTHPEWADAFRRDPQGNERTLIPVRIDNCQPTGLLATIIYADLYGKSEEEAHQTLLTALADRAKPAEPTPFPGGPATDQPSSSAAAPSSPAPSHQAPATTVNWETLSGPQQGEFVEAMLSAYGARGSLEQMLLFELDVRLSEIAGSGNMREVTMAVVKWAVAQTRAKELFDGARSKNNGNQALKQLEAKLLAMAPAPQQNPPLPTPSPSTTSPSTGSAPSATEPAPSPSSHVGGDDVTTDISDSSGIAIGRGNTVNVTNHIYNPPAESAPFPGQASSSSANSTALNTWREKLEFLLEQEAITADANQKFALKKQIEEARAKIQELS